jgi:transcriptional regulator with XRE-family HTH domain
VVGTGTDLEGFGALVRKSRTAAGLTLDDLAEGTGLGMRTINDIEQGLVHRPHRSSLELICEGTETLPDLVCFGCAEPRVQI